MGEGSSFPLLQPRRCPWVATCSPDVWISPQIAAPASPESTRHGQARPSLRQESCSSLGPAAFSPNLPPPPRLSLLGASQPRDAPRGCVWT